MVDESKKSRTVKTSVKVNERKLRSGARLKRQRRRHAQSAFSARTKREDAEAGTKPRGKELETRENKPINPTAVVNNVQDQRKQQQRPPARRNSIPARPKNEIIQGVSPKLAPLTAENLRAKAAIDDDDDDIDPLGRLLGDNMRTFMQGFALPTIYQSDITPSTEEEGEAKD